VTKLLDKAIETVRGLPASQQDEIARAILDVAEDWEGEEDIDPGAVEGILEGLADADAGRIATDEEVEAAYRRFGK
jgi:predicted transcriptional regulator